MAKVADYETVKAAYANFFAAVEAGKNDVAKYVKDSTAFYTKLIERAYEANCAMNVFSCSTDQIGLYEMNALCRETGGTMMISESFAYQAFTRTWRIFLEMQSDSNPEAPIKSQGGSTMQVSCSPNIKIHGVLGPCHSLKTGGQYASNIEIGSGNTDKW